MNTPAFSIIRTTRTATEADLLIAVLRSAGLHPLELQTASHFSLAGADVSYHVQVPAEEVTAAQEFLQEHDDSIHPT